jgi:hypothetical protein
MHGPTAVWVPYNNFVFSFSLFSLMFPLHIRFMLDGDQISQIVVHLPTLEKEAALGVYPTLDGITTPPLLQHCRRSGS